MNGCDNIIGFLFPHRCGRTTTIGCPYCDQSNISQDDYFHPGAYHPYQEDRKIYPNFGNFDFTEADSNAFTSHESYETELGAS
ncbi:MAG: hypothetical protein HC919_08595 [Oscillatoriales cyanobacterium SM2_2_1]|nr:hypothetical protein [Oscillatoriales cyanobacterium SM2_2_1]